MRDRTAKQKSCGRRIIAPLLLCLLLLSGCKTTLDVRVRARPEGSGVIAVTAVLDKEAAQWLGRNGANGSAGPLAASDLEGLGWTVLPVATTDNGGSTFGVQHSFGSVAEANQLLSQLSAADGPFSKLRLIRKRGLVNTSLRLEGPVDLSKRLDAFGDEQLRALTGGTALIGVPENSLIPDGTAVDKALKLQVTTDLGSGVKTVPLPLGAVTDVASVSKVWTWEAAAGIGGALAGLIALVVVRRAGRRD